MKKVWLALLAAAVLIAAVIVPFVMGMGQQAEPRMYDTYLAKYGAEAVEGGSMTVTLEGTTLSMDAAQADSILNRLITGRSQRIKLEAVPEGVTAHLTVKLTEDASVDVYALDADKNNTALIAQLGDSSYRWEIDGLRIYGWVEDLALGKAK